MKISSPSNPRVKTIVRLKSRKARRESGLAVVDGFREVSRARQAGVTVTELYVCPERLEAGTDQTVKDWSVPVIEVSEAVYRKMSYGDRRDGVLAVIQTPEAGLARIPENTHGLYLIADRMEKPGNLGAVIRTCDAAGITALLVSDPATDLFNPNVIRSSLGTVFGLPAACASSAEIAAFLKQRGVRILAASPAAEKDYTEPVYALPAAIVIGSEHQGLSPEWLDCADEQLRIPMRGQGDSLNASTSAAILVYEAFRQISGAN